MPLWLQHTIVLALVGFALFAVIRQAVSTMRMRRGAKLGSCCAKGCDAQGASSQRPAGERIVFLPAESLTRNLRR